MPWGCLCSKEKKRPQISSPILNPEDTQKLQLLPAVRLPLLSDAEKLEQRLLAPHPNADFDNESSEETQPPNDAGRDRLQQQLLQKSRLKSSNLKSTTYTRNTENDKLTRHLNTVKFSFDEPVPQKPDGAGKPLRKSSERSEPPPKPDRRITSTATQQIVVKLPDTAGNVSLEHPAADEIDCNGNGNYDIVPTIKISDNGVHGAELEGRTENKAQVDENKNEILVPGSSEGSIPFIDEDPTQILRQLNANPQRGQNFHDARIITLTPKNVGSEATRTAAAAAAATAAAATAAASEQVHREAQLRLLADTKKFTRFLVEPPPVVTVETVKFTHIFQILPPAYDRLCQQCHKALHLDIGLRCVVCDFTCHQQCVRLEKKNGREEEQQQQAINKYNSLPLHAINAQQQQQQQQPRPATNLNHVNNNHYHNYSLQPYYNRQPQQHQQSPHQHHSYPVARIAEEPSYQSLRLNYVTERILASTLPARRLQNGSSSPHASNGSLPADEHERELISMLEQKHKQNYRILDLESRLVNITLEKLCELCKYIDSWLGSGKEKIVVLQDREDKHRLGTAIAAYLQYQKICGSNIPQAGGHSKSSLSPGGSTDNGRKTPTWLDLDIFSMQKFLESFANPLRIPSHKRYIQYFSGLLSGVIKLNSSSFFLKAIRVESPPCLHYRAITVNSEWRSFIKIFEGVRCLFTSDIYVIPITTRHFIYEIKHPLRLRGDILVRCYQIIPNNNKATYEKELIASVQFHTCAITEKEVQFKKGDLDWACDDERFSAEHTMTFCFDTVPNERPMILVFQDPLVRIEPIAENGDHLETINEGWTKQDESGHTQGPLDGSLYATILKSPKSPTAPHLISPPAEFSNGKSLLLNGTGPPPVPERSKTPNSIYLSHNGTPRSTPVPFAVAPPPPASPALGNGDVKYALNESKSSATSVRTVSSSYGSYQSPGAPDGSGSPGVTLASSGKTRPSATQVDGRESVRSPLTVSMDSGISSSGPVNRRIQGSSVSPSSFPSPQASPQDDRHRELDDLLSDMMLTVQGIPDVGQKADQTNHHQSQQQQQQQHHHHHHHQQQHQNPNDHFVNTNTDTIKRSHSAQLPPVTTREDNRSRTPLTVSDYSPSAAAAAAAAAAAKERELLMYETSSTTTTLTPPPSESGRETPLLSAYASGGGTIRERDLQNINNNNLTPAERELIMSVQRHQHQSLAYPRPARSTTGASERFTSDDDDDLLGGGSSGGQIPYHAREDSRPFTYGNIPASGTPQHPPAATMIKMQSGLSSPSMVRKALGTPTAGRKTATLPRNDFEEMLRERREKVLSEKYTIGDQSPGGGTGGIMVSDTINNNNSSAGDGRWTYQQHHTVKTVTTQGAGTTPNGYPAHEPLKRSNTMDGSFGRQFSNEGISGQSWLQLQQQKLRARREQQRREHSNSFSYNYGSPAFPTGENVYSTTHRRSQTLSPVRNDRNYHTLTTTRTHSTERPFVAVQRAHENAKLQTIGNAPLSILNASPHGHIAQAQTQASSPSPSSTHTTVSSPSPAPPSTGNSVSITHHHHHHHQQTVNGSSSAAGSPVNGQQHPATPQQHRHINGNDAHYQSQQQQLNSSLNGSSGLLSLADQDHSTPKHGQVRLESEQIIFSNINSLNNLDNCEKLNNLLNEITNSAAAVASVASSEPPTQTVASAESQACISPNTTTSSVTTNSSSSSSMSASNNSASLINHNTHHVIDSYHHHHHHKLHQASEYCHRNGHTAPGEQEPMELSSPDGSVDEKPFTQPATIERRNGHANDTSVNVIGHGQLALDKLLASLALESDVTEEHLAKIDGRTNNTTNTGNGCYPEQRPTANFHPSSELSDVLANLAEYDLNETQRNGNLYHYQQHQQSASSSVDTANGNYRHYPAHGLADLVNGYTLSNGHHQQPGQPPRSTSRSSNETGVAQQSSSPQQHQSQNGSPNVQQQQQQHHHHHPHHPLLMNNHVRRIASETDSTISSISPSLSERSNAISWCDQAREESFSSYRSETEPDNSPMGGSPRPETPAFPVTPRTPYGLSNGTSSPALPPKSPTSQRKDLFSGGNQRTQELINQNETLSCYTSRRNSTTSNANSEPQEVAPQFVKFARDSSKYWYKPNISREEAIALLRNAAPGTFIVRDSTTFANAYGLVVKVNHPPPGVQYTGPNSEELVRHFLVEPTIRGVRLKGCANEPVFTSLSALVYQHSITPLALPCRLIIPDMDLQQMEHQTPAQQQLLQQGAACNVLYLFTCDTESLTGPQAIRKAVSSLLALRPLPKPTQVHFKASLQGITLTDNTRQLFFRRHYPSNNVSFCALDPDDRRWSIQSTTGDIPATKRMFAFVAKRSPSSADNQCHVFCELEPTQPAAAIIQFANKVLTGTSQQPAVTRAI
ncbi:serine-rich adhesin for platelets isoform X3 [Anopheles stephensi]|uniref:serine-rich adhesin for platelets isoform X3 n=1 Tax=Anopheles stephensi TaxID=30069 RepID=UPI001658AEA9|nr:serine-rich adhesin for platelets isoform X3 [Anopheles stephensi]